MLCKYKTIAASPDVKQLTTIRYSHSHIIIILTHGVCILACCMQ